MNKVKQVSRIVLSIAVGLCFALGAWLLIPFGIKNASADAGASAIEADAEDSWLDNGAAFIVGSQSAKNEGDTLHWRWKESEVTSNAGFQTTQGNQVEYVITGAGVNEIVTPMGILNTLNDLDVGSYTLTVRTVKTENRLSKSFSLKIDKAKNAWQTECGMESWEYGAAASEPVGEPLHGEIVYSYEKWNGSVYESVSGKPTEIGKYRVTFTVNEGKNWEALSASVEFSISNALVKIENLRASDWVWGSFDRNSHISMTASRDDVAIVLTVSRVSPLDGVSPVEFTMDTLRTSTVIYDALNELPAGEYILSAKATGEGNSLSGMTETRFNIKTATNRWLIPPSMLSWSQNNFKSENLPKAGALFGYTYLTVTNSQGDSGTEYYSGVVYSVGMSSSDPNGWVITSQDTGNTGTLNSLPGGTYYLHVRVPAEEGKYTGISMVIPVTVFTGSADRPSNYWVEVPYMNMYTSEYSEPSVPRGYALRWSEMRYEYYRAEVEGDKISITNELIGVQQKLNTAPDSGSNGVPTLVSGIVPVQPGWYFMRIISYYEESDGTVIDLDTLSYDIPFQVREAVNEWTSAPHIPSYYLSQGLPTPAAGSTTYLSDVTFLFKKEGEEDSAAVAQMPVEEGKYIMIATAYALLRIENDVPIRAKYCKPISTEVPFTVSLSTNSWVNMPSIDGWSEEFGPNDPAGKAEVGNIVYSYFLADGVTQLDGKPVEAGDYILRATVEEYGYKTLVGEVAFTISPAWDQTFVVIDIVLGVVAIAATVVAIIFAKRRISQC